MSYIVLSDKHRYCPIANLMRSYCDCRILYHRFQLLQRDSSNNNNIRETSYHYLLLVYTCINMNLITTQNCSPTAAIAAESINHSSSKIALILQDSAVLTVVVKPIVHSGSPNDRPRHIHQPQPHHWIPHANLKSDIPYYYDVLKHSIESCLKRVPVYQSRKAVYPGTRVARIKALRKHRLGTSWS